MALLKCRSIQQGATERVKPVPVDGIPRRAGGAKTIPAGPDERIGDAKTDLALGGCEVVCEHPLVRTRRIDLGERPELRVRAEDEINPRAGPFAGARLAVTPLWPAPTERTGLSVNG